MTPEDKRFFEFVNAALPKGRYAAALNDTDYVFVRRTVPKTGFFKGKSVIQYQMAERWGTCYVFEGDTGRMERYFTSPVSVDILKLIVMDYKRAALAYARELGQCARCGIQLTDEISRANMVGPECIKHWPWMPDLAAREREKAESR